MHQSFGDYLEVPRKTRNYLKISVILFIGFFIFREVIYGDEIKRDILLSEKRNATVIDIYNDKNEHNYTFVKFSNGNKELLEFPYQIGDSVSKSKGDSIEYIFRNKKVIKNNWLKNYKKPS
jgi:hypothetical protein